MGGVTEQHLLDWREALPASKISPIAVKKTAASPREVVLRMGEEDQEAASGSERWRFSGDLRRA
jgi:hypothetical protein